MQQIGPATCGASGRTERSSARGISLSRRSQCCSSKTVYRSLLKYYRLAGTRRTRQKRSKPDLTHSIIMECRAQSTKEAQTRPQRETQEARRNQGLALAVGRGAVGAFLVRCSCTTPSTQSIKEELPPGVPSSAFSTPARRGQINTSAEPRLLTTGAVRLSIFPLIAVRTLSRPRHAGIYCFSILQLTPRLLQQSTTRTPSSISPPRIYNNPTPAVARLATRSVFSSSTSSPQTPVLHCERSNSRCTKSLVIANR